jgi:PEP-CTERM motif
MTTSVRADSFSFSPSGRLLSDPRTLTATEVGHSDFYDIIGVTGNVRSGGFSFPITSVLAAGAVGSYEGLNGIWKVDGTSKEFDIPQFDSVSVTENSPVPEPSSLALFGVGIMGVAGALRRRLAV